MTPLHFYLYIAGVVGLSFGQDGPPVFKSIPTTVKTTEHDTVLLPCYLDNQGGVSVRWWKDEVLVAESSRGSTSVEGASNIRLYANYTLEISDVTSSDTGRYVCQVVRPPPWGPINQHHAIQVLYPPALKTSPESGVLEAKLNEEVTISCIPSGVPKPIISWSFKGEEIQLLNNRNSLRFTTSKPSMAGDYTCTASNGVGDTAVATITLKITYPPEVYTEKLWVHTSPGVRTELSCEIRGIPQPKVEWLVNGHPVVLGSHRIIYLRSGDKHVLVLTSTRISDFGFYTCRATNPLGQREQVIQLSGIANVAVFKKSSKQQGENNYTLIWEVDSYTPIIEYRLLFRQMQREKKSEDWSRLIVPADPYTPGPLYNQMYILTGLNKSTTYEASILSRNRFGWSRPSAVYRFTTVGPDLVTEETTEDNLETNTISLFLPDDYSTDAVEAHGLNSSSHYSYNFYSLNILVSLVIHQILKHFQ